MGGFQFFALMYNVTLKIMNCGAPLQSRFPKRMYLLVGLLNHSLCTCPTLLGSVKLSQTPEPNYISTSGM